MPGDTVDLNKNWLRYTWSNYNKKLKKIQKILLVLKLAIDD